MPVDQNKISELKRLRSYAAGFGQWQRVAGFDAEIAKLRAAADKDDAKAEAEAEEAEPAPVESAVESPHAERAVASQPSRQPRRG